MAHSAAGARPGALRVLLLLAATTPHCSSSSAPLGTGSLLQLPSSSTANHTRSPLHAAFAKALHADLGAFAGLNGLGIWVAVVNGSERFSITLGNVNVTVLLQL